MIRQMFHLNSTIFSFVPQQIRISSSTCTLVDKMAAFHHMIHRMESLSLSKVGKRKEREQIFKISGVNDYPERWIQDNREFGENIGGIQWESDILTKVKIEEIWTGSGFQ